MSASCVCHACGMVSLERAMFSAISRRTRVSCTTSSPSAGLAGGAGAAAGGALGVALAFAAKLSTSLRVTRPPSPLPVTWARSTFSSEAAIWTPGEKRCSSPAPLAGGGADGAGGAGAVASGRSAVASGRSAVTVPRAGRTSADAVPSPVSMTAIATPACTVSPSLASISRRIPDTGAGTSALTLSVSTSSIGSNSTTLSPGLTSHFEIVPSCTDSPSCGITTRVVWPATSVRRQVLQDLRDLLRRRHEELLHRRGVWHRWHVEPTQPLDRRVEPAPRLVGDERCHFGANGDAEVVLVEDEAFARLARGRDDRLLVERVHGAQVDDLDAD